MMTPNPHPPTEGEPLVKGWTSFRLHAMLERWEDGYVAYLPDVPGIVEQGDTADRCLDNLRNAVLFTLQADAEPVQASRNFGESDEGRDRG